ncbi:MAG: glycosyltransferase [Patescibacteria group bacterium]|jgi:glycosyltransferase involved in cell wall biosynthesis
MNYPINQREKFSTVGNKRIAIFHNFLDNIGGAEVVSLLLARGLKADIYTTNIDKEKISKMGFATSNIFSIGKVPLNAPFRQELTHWSFRKLNLGKKYDFYIISGDWAMSGAINNQPNLWYIYSPMREIFDLYPYTRKTTVPSGQRHLFDCWVFYHRWLIKKNSQKIKKLISISQNVQARVKKYLGKDSEIIYPPTETSQFFYNQNGNFWLSVNRLINHKRLEIQLDAFRQLPKEKLVIVGSYESANHFRSYARYIMKTKPANVEILSWVTKKELITLYSNCKGFITTSKDEDYGLNVVEAMASGKPVIAPNEGGYKETIINHVTGKLIDDINPEKLVEVIKEVGQNPVIYREACQKQAKRFDLEIFIEKIKKIINE